MHLTDQIFTIDSAVAKTIGNVYNPALIGIAM